VMFMRERASQSPPRSSIAGNDVPRGQSGNVYYMGALAYMGLGIQTVRGM